MDDGSGVAAARYSGEVLSGPLLGKRFRGTGKIPFSWRLGGYRGCNGCGTSMNFGDSGRTCNAGADTEKARTAPVTAQQE